MLGLLEPNLEKLTAFDFECYRAAKYASNIVDAEELENMQNKSGNNEPEKFGGNVTIQNKSEPEHDPFNW